MAFGQLSIALAKYRVPCVFHFKININLISFTIVLHTFHSHISTRLLSQSYARFIVISRNTRNDLHKNNKPVVRTSCLHHYNIRKQIRRTRPATQLKRMGRDHLHVAMLPWLAFGHMIPFFKLSIALAKSGVHVSLLSTPRNIQRLPTPPPSLSPFINLVELPFPLLDDDHLLPEGAEATVDIPIEKMDSLKLAYDLLKRPFNQYVLDDEPDWIFLDFNPDWAVDVAQEHGVPIVWFSVFCAATNVFLGPVEYLSGEGQRRVRPSPESLTLPPEWVTFPSSVACRSFDKNAIYSILFEQNATGKKDGERIAKILDASQAVAIRTCSEFEGEYLNVCEKINGKPAIPVGLLLPEKGEEREDESWGEVFKWLDEQKPRTVVFVGFGSECKLTKDQIYEIAYGLELSELPFLWALRKPSWAIDDHDALPLGFSHRTSSSGKGMVCMGWVPQMKILAHPSIGGSLFHSGWGSLIETLEHGHCLVVLPFIVDQGLNARLLVDKGLAVEIEREVDGSFSRNDIAKSLRLAMVLEEGEELRVRTREAAAIFGDQKLQENYIHGFVQYLKNGVTRQK